MASEEIKTYKSLLAIDNANAAAMNGLGVCLDIKGQHDEAQSWYRKALQETPNDANIKSNLGLSLALGKKTQESISILLPLSQETSPSSNVLHNLAIAYALSGQVGKAREIFAKELNSKEVEANLATLKAIS